MADHDPIIDVINKRTGISAAAGLVDQGKTLYADVTKQNAGAANTVLTQYMDSLRDAEQSIAKQPYSDRRADASVALIAAQKTLKGYTGEGMFHHAKVTPEIMDAALKEYATNYDTTRSTADVGKSILQSMHVTGFDEGLKTQALQSLAKMDPVSLRMLDQRLKSMKNKNVCDDTGVDQSAGRYAVDVLRGDDKLADKDRKNFRDALSILATQGVNPTDGIHSAVVKGLLVAAGTPKGEYDLQYSVGFTNDAIKAGTKVKWDMKASTPDSRAAAAVAATAAAAPATAAAPAPPPVSAASLPPAKAAADNGVRFDSGSVAISAADAKRLHDSYVDQFKAMKAKSPDRGSLKVDVEVNSSTDGKGSKATNDRISAAREKALEAIVVSAAKDAGVTANIHADSQGMKGAVAGKKDDARRQAHVTFKP